MQRTLLIQMEPAIPLQHLTLILALHLASTLTMSMQHQPQQITKTSTFKKLPRQVSEQHSI